MEGKLEPLAEPELPYLWSADPVIKKREAELAEQLNQGPPQRGTKAAPITWLFEPESFAPMAKLVGDQQFSILSDHRGTPVLMVDRAGARVWSASMSVYGELRGPEGQRHACPFRWPGQYEDLETGLYYNRFRYYDAEAGQYASQDPIGLWGGTRSYGYVREPTGSMDPLGLTGCKVTDRRIGPASQVENFREGAAVFMPEGSYKWASSNFANVGRPDGLFVMRKSAADKLQGMDKSTIRKKLGIPNGTKGWDGPLVRVDIPDPLSRNPRMASGMEEGANKLFKPGGYTSGGVQEIVTDPVPWSAVSVSKPF